MVRKKPESGDERDVCALYGQVAAGQSQSQLPISPPIVPDALRCLSSERSVCYSEAGVNWDHQSRMLLLEAWLIGLSISIFAVGCTFLAHTPMALIGLVLSVPMLPFTFILVSI